MWPGSFDCNISTYAIGAQSEVQKLYPLGHLAYLVQHAENKSNLERFWKCDLFLFWLSIFYQESKRKKKWICVWIETKKICGLIDNPTYGMSIMKSQKGINSPSFTLFLSTACSSLAHGLNRLPIICGPQYVIIFFKQEVHMWYSRKFSIYFNHWIRN